MSEIWSFCQTCWVRTRQLFVRDEGNAEVYQCETCKCLHRVVVR